MRLSQLSYDPVTGDLLYPPLEHERAPETDLAGYLVAALHRFDTAPAWTQTTPHPGALSAEFEHLRWFDLPAESLSS